MTLLVPVDFSDCTHGLVERAADMASRLGVTITLLHAVDTPSGLVGARLPGGAASEQLSDESSSQLRYYAAKARQTGVTVEGITRVGSPEEVILAAADELGAEMIMMGTHGRRGVNRLMLGSIAEFVLRRAEVPVITVRTQHRPECEARSCAVCSTHVTRTEARLAVELEG